MAKNKNGTSTHKKHGLGFTIVVIVLIIAVTLAAFFAQLIGPAIAINNYQTLQETFNY